MLEKEVKNEKQKIVFSTQNYDLKYYSNVHNWKIGSKKWVHTKQPHIWIEVEMKLEVSPEIVLLHLGN